MISHRHKCIFIHIPKCAGTSIEAALGHHEFYDGRGMQDHRTLSQLQPSPIHLLNGVKKLSAIRKDALRRLGYKPNRNTKNSHVVNASQYNDYFKFTFVRNPWDRAYSWYRNVIRDETNRKNFDVDANVSFEEFVTRFVGTGNLRSQLFWIRDRHGKIDIDFIGRFENLQHDFHAACTSIGIKPPTLPHKLDGGRKDYRIVYDAKIRRLVEEVYSEEISLFGYSFE